MTEDSNRVDGVAQVCNCQQNGRDGTIWAMDLIRELGNTILFSVALDLDMDEDKSDLH